MEQQELGQLRHDLKNVMSAFSLGCNLIEKRLPPGADPTLHEFIEEMRAEAAKGVRALERWRELERQQGDASQ